MYNVTPYINFEDEILFNLSPEVSSLGGRQAFGAGQIEALRFHTTKVKTPVLIKRGQAIASGSRLTDQTNIKEIKAPYLGDLPLTGKVFRSKIMSTASSLGRQEAEKLFFVTVITVDSQGQSAGAKVDGKNDQSKDDQAKQKTAATDAAPSLKGSGRKVVSEKANKDKPA